MVTLYMSQEDTAAASETLVSAVNWYKKNQVGDKSYISSLIVIQSSLS
jgi:hypothetical protein